MCACKNFGTFFLLAVMKENISLGIKKGYGLLENLLVAPPPLTFPFALDSINLSEALFVPV